MLCYSTWQYAQLDVLVLQNGGRDINDFFYSSVLQFQCFSICNRNNFVFFLNQNMKTLGLSSSRESLKKILLIPWTTIPCNIIRIIKISCTQSLASVGTCHMTRSLFLTWEGSRQKLINTCLGIYDILYYD